jgi:hypothetical protein
MSVRGPRLISVAVWEFAVQTVEKPVCRRYWAAGAFTTDKPICNNGSTDHSNKSWCTGKTVVLKPFPIPRFFRGPLNFLVKMFFFVRGI